LHATDPLPLEFSAALKAPHVLQRRTCSQPSRIADKHTLVFWLLLLLVVERFLFLS